MSGLWLNKREFAHYYGYCQEPLDVMCIGRACIVNPDEANRRLLSSPNEEGLRIFLSDAMTAVAKIYLRRSGNTILVSDQVANDLSRRFLNNFFKVIPKDDANLGAHESEINRTKEQNLGDRPFPDVVTLIKVINAYFLNSYNRESPSSIREIANAWRTFLKSDSPFARECRGADNDGVMSQYARQGYLEQKFLIQDGKINWSNIKMVFDIHRKIALERNITNYGSIRRETEALIKAYEPVMTPEFVYYQMQSTTVIAKKREEFSQHLRRAYLITIAKAASRTVMPPLSQFKSSTLDAMKRGSFGQMKFADDVFALSVEHVVPLSAGDNFFQNFSIESNIVNYDMNRLVRLQTTALRAKADKVDNRNGYNYITHSGDAWPIIVLRPKGFLSNGLTAPLILGEHNLIVADERTVKSISRDILDAPFRSKDVQRHIQAGRIPSPDI